MATTNCPTLMAISNDDICLENFAGLGSKAYFFNKDDLSGKLSPVSEDRPNVYSWTDDTLKSGKVLYAVELKTGSQSITGESNGARKGFKQTGQLIIEVVNEKTAVFMRALNNLDWGAIIPDGDKYQIMYNPSYKITLDSGAVKSETGAAASDDRIVTLAPVVDNCKYSNNWVEFPSGKTPDDYLTVSGS